MTTGQFSELVGRLFGEVAVAEDSTESRSDVYVGGVRLKSVRQIYGEDGSVHTIENSTPLACDHVVHDSESVQKINGDLYCKECAPRCPTCGEWILPGEGKSIEDIWYHKGRCVADPEKHFEIGRALGEYQEAVKLEGALAQVDHTKAQTQAALENIALQRERFLLDVKREEAQIHSVYENLDHQERKLRIDREGHRSRMLNEEVQRESAVRKWKLDLLETMARLEEKGLLRKGTTKRLR